MPAADPGIVASPLQDGKTWVDAAIPLAVALVVVLMLDRALSRRGRRIAEAVMRGDISPETYTRLRFIRRLVYALILLIGVVGSLSYFEGVSRLAASLLASGVIAAAVVGFAAHQTLANVVAGIMLAVTQPLRVGDWVYFEEHYGEVEDVRLNYTILRTLGDQRVIIPNEQLASGVLRNDTLGSDSVALEVQIWLPVTVDAGRAVAALEDETGQTVTVAETTVEGVRLAVGGDPSPPPERSAREAELRLRCLARLRADGLVATAE